MKFLKKIGIAFFSILLINFIGLFVLSMEMKPLLINGIVKEMIKNEYLSKSVRTQDSSSNQEDVIEQYENNEQLEELLNKKEIQELIDKYITLTMNSL